MGQKESKPTNKSKADSSPRNNSPDSTKKKVSDVQDRSNEGSHTIDYTIDTPKTTTTTTTTSSSTSSSVVQGASKPVKEVSKARTNPKETLETFYQKYKDATEDAILAEGVESFCDDLGVSPTDFIVLVLAWKFQASEMCRFTKEEFINGCQKLKAMDAKELKQRFPDLIKETNESEKSFKELYQFTFTFGLDHASGQRVLPTEMAVQLWELLFTHKNYPLLSKWLDFIQTSNVKMITRDTWNMFLPFLQTMKDTLENYDESEAWPTLFDDFVEHEQANATSVNN